MESKLVRAALRLAEAVERHDSMYLRIRDVRAVTWPSDKQMEDAADEHLAALAAYRAAKAETAVPASRCPFCASDRIFPAEPVAPDTQAFRCGWCGKRWGMNAETAVSHA